MRNPHLLFDFMEATGFRGDVAAPFRTNFGVADGIVLSSRHMFLSACLAD